jgi:hypothetical protein
MELAFFGGELPEEANIARDRDVLHLIPPIVSIEEVLIEDAPTYKRPTLDRRGLLRGISFRTSELTGEVEDRLGENCEAKWRLELEGVDDTLRIPTYLALFEHAMDKKQFIEFISREARFHKP